MQLLGALNRTVGYGTGGALSGPLAGQRRDGLRAVVISSLMPVVEWRVDQFPERRLGAFGAVL